MAQQKQKISDAENKNQTLTENPNQQKKDSEQASVLASKATAALQASTLAAKKAFKDQAITVEALKAEAQKRFRSENSPVAQNSKKKPVPLTKNNNPKQVKGESVPSQTSKPSTINNFKKTGKASQPNDRPQASKQMDFDNSTELNSREEERFAQKELAKNRLQRKRAIDNQIGSSLPQSATGEPTAVLSNQQAPINPNNEQENFPSKPNPEDSLPKEKFNFNQMIVPATLPTAPESEGDTPPPEREINEQEPVTDQPPPAPEVTPFSLSTTPTGNKNEIDQVAGKLSKLLLRVGLPSCGCSFFAFIAFFMPLIIIIILIASLGL